MQSNVVDLGYFKLSNSVNSNNQTLKYQRSTPSGFIDKGLENLSLLLNTFISELKEHLKILKSIVKGIVHLFWKYTLCPKPTK